MERESRVPGLAELTVKAAVVHTVTYFAMGAFAAALLDYKAAFARPEFACWMRPIGDPAIAAGPMLQPIRGIIFALAFFPIRSVIFGARRGWLALWWLLVALAVLSTFGPAPGSVEGFIYTYIPIGYQIRGWIEVIPQAGLLSWILTAWVHRPEKKWVNWVLGSLFVLVYALMVLNFLAPGHK